MADNSRHILAANNALLSRANPTGITGQGGAGAASFTIGAWMYIPAFDTANGQGMWRVGTPTNVLTRGFEFGIQPSKVLQTRNGAGSFVSGSTVLTAATWFRWGFAMSGLFNQYHSLNGASDGSTSGLDPEAALTTGDVIQSSVGKTGVNWTRANQWFAWFFYLQGVQLSAAAIGSYLNDPKSLYDAYGPSGTVVANALKLLCPGQCGVNAATSEADRSGVGNDGTYTGTTSPFAPLGSGDGPSPTTPWAPCSAAGRLLRLPGLDGLTPPGALNFNPTL